MIDQQDDHWIRVWHKNSCATRKPEGLCDCGLIDALVRDGVAFFGHASGDVRGDIAKLEAENARLQERVVEAEREIGLAWARGLEIWDYVHLQLLPDCDEARALEFYADSENWAEDSWGVRAILQGYFDSGKNTYSAEKKGGYGNPEGPARAALAQGKKCGACGNE